MQGARKTALLPTTLGVPLTRAIRAMHALGSIMCGAEFMSRQGGLLLHNTCNTQRSHHPLSSTPGPSVETDTSFAYRHIGQSALWLLVVMWIYKAKTQQRTSEGVCVTPKQMARVIQRLPFQHYLGEATGRLCRDGKSTRTLLPRLFRFAIPKVEVVLCITAYRLYHQGAGAALCAVILRASRSAPKRPHHQPKRLPQGKR